jgi:phage FluMu protein Com
MGKITIDIDDSGDYVLIECAECKIVNRVSIKKLREYLNRIESSKQTRLS